MNFTNDDPLVEFSDQGGGHYLLDVRELLLSGGEPRTAIFHCVNQLQPGEQLELHAIFEPVPLIRKLGNQGFKLESTHLGLDHWVLAIRRG